MQFGAFGGFCFASPNYHREHALTENSIKLACRRAFATALFSRDLVGWRSVFNRRRAENPVKRCLQVNNADEHLRRIVNVADQ